MSTISLHGARSPVLAFEGIGSLNIGAEVESVVNGQTTTESFGIEPVVLEDDGRTRFAGVGGAAGDGPDLTSPHSASQAEMASTNDWSFWACELLATAAD